MKHFKLRIFSALVFAALILSSPIFAYGYTQTEIGNMGFSQVIATLYPKPAKYSVEEIKPINVLKSQKTRNSWPVCGNITSRFGEPHWPWQPRHTGIDIANPYGKIGDPVKSFRSGKVVKIQNNSWVGYGKHVIIKHGDKLSSLYGHLSKITVKQGDKIKKDTIIGLEGSTGMSTGPHVHFEVRINNQPIDPTPFLKGQPTDC